MHHIIGNLYIMGDILAGSGFSIIFLRADKLYTYQNN